jgi:lipopolysaccharide transport system ATP-binding protein
MLNTSHNTKKTSVEFIRVKLEFPVYSAHGRSFKRSLLQFTTGGKVGFSDGQHMVVSALDDVSFEAKHGERIGLIGHNGAGKSSILRAVAGVYEPTEGAISINGRVASLIDLTMGMDMEATGYENIFIRGLLVGLSRDEIKYNLNDIANVTELGSFLEMPVRTYSSGMLLRLAFAISTSISPDVLLMDEWIGVGDASFVKKANARLVNVLGKAGILFLASHSDEIIRKYCNRVLWMDKGKIREDGDPVSVLNAYQKWSAAL